MRRARFNHLGLVGSSLIRSVHHHGHSPATSFRRRDKVGPAGSPSLARWSTSIAISSSDADRPNLGLHVIDPVRSDAEATRSTFVNIRCTKAFRSIHVRQGLMWSCARPWHAARSAIRLERVPDKDGGGSCTAWSHCGSDRPWQTWLMRTPVHCCWRMACRSLANAELN